ncbi:MAG: acyltransferase, partial [Duncaniella sp.]|uniref:nitrilase-related carbon-nitrogen hydrolase n=1 Tax=Duncaniella sp. TaxID=2518496 RepID=UPI0023D6CF9A
MLVGLIQQHNTTDIDNNRRRLAEKVINLAAKGAELVVLQELHDSLYFCQIESVDNFDIAVSLDAASPVTEFYSSLAREAGVVLVTSLFERRAAGLYHNTSLVF